MGQLNAHAAKLKAAFHRMFIAVAGQMPPQTDKAVWFQNTQKGRIRWSNQRHL